MTFSDFGKNFTFTMRQLRPKNYVYSERTPANGPYVYYQNSSERNRLNQNSFSTAGEVGTSRSTISVFPLDIYQKPVMEVPEYICDGPRDKRTDYIIGRDRETHTPFFSRFGRADAWNGYGVGNWSSGKYKISDNCANSPDFDDPPGMALPSAYGENPYTVTSVGSTMYYKGKQPVGP